MMDRRKSLGDVLAISTRPTPLRRRSSFAVRVSDELKIEANDDVVERQILRSESSGQLLQSPVRRSAHFGAIISHLSSPQIQKGIAECIKLNNQNKINIKNAFSLNIIDYMTYMVRNKNGGIQDLHLVATTLDVSAKIYALRVDALYQDTLKMSNNLYTTKKKRSTYNNSTGNETMMEIGDADENNNNNRLKKKKSRRSKKILTTIEALQEKAESVDYTPVMFGDGDCQTTDMLHLASLPVHCGLGLSLNPYNDMIIDTAEENIENNDEPRINWPPIKVDFANREINDVFSSFEFLHWSVEQEQGGSNKQSLNVTSQESVFQGEDNLVFDLDASILPEDENNNLHTNENDKEVEVEVGCSAKSPTPCVVANLENIIERMPSDKKPECSFLSEEVDIHWVGPAYWKIKKLFRDTDQSKPATCQRKKKNFVIASDDEHIETANKKCSTLAKIKSITLKRAITKSWSPKKLIVPEKNDEDYDNISMLMYYLRPHEFLTFKNSTNNNNNNLVIPDDNEVYNYDNNNDMNYCPNAKVNDDDGVASNDCSYDVSQPIAITDSNFIETPKLTQKLPTCFAQRAKKLDVHHLKKCIWKVLTDIGEPLGEMEERKKFSDVFYKLPKMLSESDAEDLSFSTAFVTLLGLAVEKKLIVTSDENFGDIFIDLSTH